MSNKFLVLDCIGEFVNHWEVNKSDET